MKTKTYVIVQSYTDEARKIWEAYKDSWYLRLSGYNTYGVPRASLSFDSADDCEQRLRTKVESERLGVVVVRRVQV